MAGVGDEIDPHALRSHRFAAIGKQDKARAAFDWPDPNRPRPLDSADPDDRQIGAPSRKDEVQGLRMAKSEADVAADDVGTEEAQCRRIGRTQHSTGHDQRRFFDCVEQALIACGRWHGVALTAAGCRS